MNLAKKHEFVPFTEGAKVLGVIMDDGDVIIVDVDGIIVELVLPGITVTLHVLLSTTFLTRLRLSNVFAYT